MKKGKNGWKEKGKKLLNWINDNQNYIVYVLIFISMLILNCLTPYIADDINYRYIWNTSNRVHNIWDVLISQYNHYLTWGGRSIAHTIAQIFLIFPKMIFNIANSLCYVGILSKINSITTQKKKNAWILLLIHLMLFLIVPYFGEDFLWLIGSCNYAWTMLFVLILIDVYQKDKKNTSKKKAIGMFLLGILAGWSNENISVALIIMIVLFLVFKKLIEKSKITNWQKTGLVGSIIGCLLLLLAPGNYARSSAFVQEGSFIKTIIGRMIEITENALINLWPLLIGVLVLYTYYFYKKKQPNIMSFIFLAGSIIATYAMAASPQFPPRAWVGIVIFLTISTVSLLDSLVEKERLIRFIFYDVIIILSVLSLRNYYGIAHKLRIYNQVIEQRENYIKEHPNEKIYYFEKYVIDDKYSPIHGEDLTEDKENWINKSQANRYGVPYIIGF
ncbi:MAG: hypothetical protein IKF71_02070 [Bacilli bacterium]|nr:hypothetical protein [Bacilli bacterium]